MRFLLLLDEHVPVALADALRTQGLDVLHLVDTDLRGAADDEVLSAAARLGRGHAGVILIPSPRGIGELVRRLVGKLDEYAGMGLRDTVLFV